MILDFADEKSKVIFWYCGPVGSNPIPSAATEGRRGLTFRSITPTYRKQYYFYTWIKLVKYRYLER